MLIDSYIAKDLIKNIESKNFKFKILLDLGLLEFNILFDENEKVFIVDNKEKISLEKIEKLSKKDNEIIILKDEMIYPAEIYNEDTSILYNLVATKKNSPPTVHISGIKMHATLNTDPLKDAKDKVKTFKKVYGEVLDTCMNLGYTSMTLLKYASKLHSCEIMEDIINLAKLNPYSKELFSSDKITIHNRNIKDLILEFEDKQFNFILHDPPSYSTAVYLYSHEFYKNMYDKLKNNGKIYHYTGMPKFKNRSSDLISKTIKKFKEVGFGSAYRTYQGVIAEK
jgi:predicted methyltransferase